MTKEVTTVSEEGFSATTEVRDFDVEIDSSGEEAPDTLESLLAAYGSCYVPALRVGGQQRGVDELGRVEIAVAGETNDDDKLESISFEIRLEADVDDETGEQILERADQLCKVEDALKESLRAEKTVDGNAF